MKRSSAAGYSVTLDMPRITRILPSQYNRRKIKKQPDDLPKRTPPPTEEMVNHLNRIGKEYPFCVYYKQKTHDPL